MEPFTYEEYKTNCDKCEEAWEKTPGGVTDKDKALKEVVAGIGHEHSPFVKLPYKYNPGTYVI